MRREMRVFLSVVLVAAFSVTVLADNGRGTRSVKSDGISLHLASSSPQAGFRQITTSTGDRVFVSPRATWTSLDVLSVDTLPGRNGETLSLRLSGSATRRLTDQLRRVGDTQVAIYSGKSVIAVADVNLDGSLTVETISLESSQQIRRVVDSDRVTPAGPLVTVVSAGQLGGQFLVDVYVEGVDTLRGYQVRLLTGGGDSGTLELKSVTIDKAREDFVFFGSNTIGASSAALRQLASVRYDGPVAASQASYIGTYAYTATSDASGLFRVNVELGNNSVLVAGQNTEMGFNVGADARIFVGSLKGSKDTK